MINFETMLTLIFTFLLQQFIFQVQFLLQKFSEVRQQLDKPFPLMKSRARQNEKFKQRIGMPIFNQLQIQSRKDLNKKIIDVVQDDNIDCIPQLSWDLIDEQVGPQKVISNHKVINSEPKLAKIEEDLNFKPMSQFHQSKVLLWDPSSMRNNIQNYQTLQAQNKQQYSAENREIQILQRKQYSNYQYIKTQVNQILKLITCTIMFQDQLYLKNQINQLTAKVRRIRLKSLSSRKIQKRYGSNYYDKETKRIQQSLNEQLKNTKMKSNKLGTKLLLMDNYLRVNQKPKQSVAKSNRFIYNIRSQYNLGYTSMEPQQDNYNIKRLKSSHPKSFKNMNVRLKSQPKLELISKSPSHSKANIKFYGYDQEEQINVLKEYKIMVKSNIQNTMQYLSSKEQCLRNQHTNLKQQLQMIELKIQKINSYTRKMRSSSQGLRNKQSLAAYTLKSIKSQRNLIKNRKTQTKQQQIPIQSLSGTQKTIKMRQKQKSNSKQALTAKMNNDSVQNNKNVLPSQSIINSLSKEDILDELINNQQAHPQNYKNIRCEYYDQAMQF